MQKLGCHGGGEFTPVEDIILQSNMPKGGNLLRGGGISSMTVQKEYLHAHSHIMVMYSIASVLYLSMQMCFTYMQSSS